MSFQIKTIILACLLIGIRLANSSAQTNPRIAYELEFSTYLGGQSYDDGLFMEIDSLGCIYLSGNTSSTDFPTTPGAYRRTMYNSQTTDLFITKMKADGSDLVYSTFFGGPGYDGHDYFVEIDEKQQFYVAGVTNSVNFPTTADAYDRSYNAGERDCFIMAMNAEGTGPVYSTFMAIIKQSLSPAL